MHLVVICADQEMALQLQLACPEGWRVSLAEDSLHLSRLATGEGFDAAICRFTSVSNEAFDMLSAVSELRPEAIRILATPRGSDSSQPRLAEQARAAQQLLHEPIDSRELRATMRRLLTTRSLMSDPELRRLLGGVQNLPSPPAVYLDLQSACRDPEIALSKVGKIVASDTGLATRVLRMANSAMYSRGRPIRNLDEAVARLGLQTLLQLVAAAEAFAQAGPDAAGIQARGLLASRIAQTIAPQDVSTNLAGTAALLADLGELLPESVMEKLDDQRPDWRGLPRRNLFGACLLALWGLPMELVEAVAYRTRPSRIERGRFGLVGCVHVACALAAGEDPDPFEVDALQIGNLLTSWQRIAERYREAASA